MEHVNGWCFRGIYKGGLWENDLHVSALQVIYYWHKVKHIYPTKLKGTIAKKKKKIGIIITIKFIFLYIQIVA